MNSFYFSADRIQRNRATVNTVNLERPTRLPYSEVRVWRIRRERRVWNLGVSSGRSHGFPAGIVKEILPREMPLRPGSERSDCGLQFCKGQACEAL